MKFKDIEIHSLICHKDIHLAINCIKSLVKYKEFSNLPIFFHDDGSLTDTDIQIIKNIEINNNINLIDKKTADLKIIGFIEKYPNCLKYRLGNKNNIYLWHKIKSFDYFFFSKTKKILGLDTDLLFTNRPSQVIEYINNSIPFYFPDNQSAYCFNEPKDEIAVLPNVNTGLIHIPGDEYYNINSIENALSNLIKNEINYFPSWIEQSAFAHMFYVDGRYKSLDPEKNKIPFFQEVNFNNVECLHFVSYPPVRALYKNYLARLDFYDGKKIKQLSLKVEYENKLIPLSIEIYENNSFYNFDFDWDIKSVGIDALSHCFKIKDNNKEELYDFGSNKNGFFLYKKEESIKEFNLKLFHTYDWYGKKNWKRLI